MATRKNCPAGSDIFRKSIRGIADEQVLSDLADWGEGLPCRVGNRRRERDTALYLDLPGKAVSFAIISNHKNGAYIWINPSVIQKRAFDEWDRIERIAGERHWILISDLTPAQFKKLRNALADAYESA